MSSMRTLALLLLMAQELLAATYYCFEEVVETQPYTPINTTTQPTLQWCHTACTENVNCAGVVYDDRSKSCVQVSSTVQTSPGTCFAPYKLNRRKTTGCPNGDPVADMPTDTCVDRSLPYLLQYGCNEYCRICEQRPFDGSLGTPIFIRYAIGGQMNTLDNPLGQKLTYDALAPLKWKIEYNGTTIYASAITCAEISLPSLCACSTPLDKYADGDKGACVPTYVVTSPACNMANPNRILASRHPRTNVATYVSPVNVKVMCVAGAWMLCSNPTGSCDSISVGGCCS